MLKKSIYVVVSLLLVQNLFADRGQLQQVNNNYMALMLGSEGILPQEATPDQINLMVDGCITAGIIDHLYGFPPKEAEFRDQITKFSGYKRLDIQLAYAFYMIGYSAPDYADLKTLIATVLPLEPNFDHEFTSICAQVYSHGDIIQYRNRLEAVIKSTSKPLRFDDFIEVRETPSLPVSTSLSSNESGVITPLTTRSRSSMSTARPKANADQSALYQKLAKLGVESTEIHDLLGDFAENYVEDGETDLSLGNVAARLESLAYNGDKERYYTKEELDLLGMKTKMAYKSKKQMPGATPKAVREEIFSQFAIEMLPKYEGK